MPGVTYKSTRGGEAGASFEYVVLGGLARDKGLFVPEQIPQIEMAELEALRGKPWTDIMFYVVSKYVGRDEIPAADLKDLVERSASTFRHEEVTPVTVLDEATNTYVLELFHGPTFAFKDVALQLLGNLFEYFLARRGPDATLTILGATSGDTGPAAIHGLRGKKGVDCFILYPKGRTSPLQERQMTTVLDRNVHCIGVHGSFDDAQAIVKAAFADQAFRDEVKLGAINSINWARVLAQMSYYFWAYLECTQPGDALKAAPTKVDFSVPTGNFGDVLAGYYARRMGLPVGTLLVATNENDILHRFFTEGKYWREPVQATIAPSMDICVSSNFERFLYHLCGDDSVVLRDWMEGFARTGKLTVEGELLECARGPGGFISGRVAKAENLANVRAMHALTGQRHLLCPHASIGVAAALKGLVPSDPGQSQSRPVVALATAHWAKFPDAVSKAVSPLPPAPEELVLLEDMQTRSYEMEPTLELVQDFVRAHMVNGSGGCLLSKLGLKNLDWGAVGVGAAAAAALVFGVVAATKKR
mmetsp:Transcript_35239/g.110934  ORF Transcript_35239/g.110934 Transcript_35239/m.110934 type:complete len:531 (-) Transcript_35239:181-1773(-)